MNAIPDTSMSRQPGRLGRALIRLFMKRLRVVGAQTVANGFRLITLESDELKGIPWTPGQKVQIAMGSAFVARTFTPIDWDTSTGQTRILGYAHGSGPGSEWVRNVAEGDECDVFGPRASLDASRVADPIVVFGDETSIGLAYSILHQDLSRTVQCLFEVNSTANVREVLAKFDLGPAALFSRTTDDSHLAEIEQRLTALAALGATFVLTGKASSIQRLRRSLKAGVPGSRLLTKVYWAPGKTGLD